jgi:hypothetical protein
MRYAIALRWTLNMTDRLGINYMAGRKTDFSFGAIFFIFDANACKPRGSQTSTGSVALTWCD